MNTSSAACKEKGAKGFQSKKNGQMFGPKMFGLPLYLRNAAPSTPIKRGSNGPAYEMRKKRQNKRKGKKARKEEKCEIRSQKKKKKKKKKTQKRRRRKYLHAKQALSEDNLNVIKRPSE